MAFFSNYEMLNIDIGSFATPQLIDLNRDGLLDLIIGERMGIDNGVYNGINYYQNIGSSTNPVFENYTPEFPSGDFDENGNEIIKKSLGGIHLADPIYLTGYTAPHIFEYNNTYHLAVGSERGLIYLYNNVETLIDENMDPTLNLSTEFNFINTMINDNNCIHSKTTIEDLNGDGLPDLIRGNSSGGLELFLANNFNITQDVNRIEKIQIFPNPNTGQFNIKIPAHINGSLYIYSTLGQLIQKKTIYLHDQIIKVSDLEAGTYIIKIEGNETTLTEKVIIKKL